MAVEQIGGLTNTNYLVRVNGERFVLRFFAAMWGMLQSGLQVEGIIPMIDGFDCLEYTEETFAQMRELIQ